VTGPRHQPCYSNRLFRYSDQQSLTLKQPAWVEQSLRDFVDLVNGTAPEFPCYFASAALRADSLRFTYLDRAEANDLGPLVDSLSRYLLWQETVTTRSALVVFVERRSIGASSLLDYEKEFWNILMNLRRMDCQPWPQGIPTDPSAKDWEMCFAGTPLFITGHCESYQHRHSRHWKGGMMLIIQTRSNMSGLVGHTKAAESTRARIRRLIDKYDAIPRSPDLGIYGDPQVREWRQYWLPDANESGARVCPLTLVAEPRY